MKRTAAILAILALIMPLMARDVKEDVAVFGKILSAAFETNGMRGLRITSFYLDDYGVFYITSRSLELFRLQRMLMLKKMREKKKRNEISPETIRQFKTRLTEKILAVITTAAKYAEVLRAVPSNQWFILVLPTHRAPTAAVVRVKIRDMKDFAAGKLSEEKFKSRIILPPELLESTPPSE